MPGATGSQGEWIRRDWPLQVGTQSDQGPGQLTEVVVAL